MPKGKEKFAERCIKMAFLRSMGKTWEDIGPELGYSRFTMHYVRRSMSEFVDEWTRFFSARMETHQQEFRRTVNAQMTKELEKRNTKALKNVDALLDSEDEQVKTANTWKLIQQNIGTPKSTLKHEGGTTQNVIHSVPIGLLNRLHERKGLPAVPSQPALPAADYEQ